MRVTCLISLTAVLLGFASSGPETVPARAAPGPFAATFDCVAETKPTTRPGADGKKKGKSIDDEIKALGLRPCSLSAIMGRWKTAKIEKKLKTWGQNGATEFEDPYKTGLNLAGMAKLVEWNKNKLRNNDPKGHDQLVADMESSARQLAESAKAKDSEGVKSAAAALEKSCDDCHARFK